LQRSVRKVRTRPAEPQPIDLGDGGEEMQQGLAKLTLTILEILRQVLERQAARRVESGTLSEEEVERLGLAFLHLAKKLAKVSESFGLRPEEITKGLDTLLKVGGKGQLRDASLVDLLDRLMGKGAVVAGQVRISVSEVDLIGVDLLAMLYPIYGERRWLDDRVVNPFA
jgi:hypothetical protein